eukprot:s1925_g2.t1
MRQIIANSLRRSIKGAYPEVKTYTYFRDAEDARGHGDSCLCLPALGVSHCIRERARNEIGMAAAHKGVQIPEELQAKIACAYSFASEEEKKGRARRMDKLMPSATPEQRQRMGPIANEASEDARRGSRTAQGYGTGGMQLQRTTLEVEEVPMKQVLTQLTPSGSSGCAMAAPMETLPTQAEQNESFFQDLRGLLVEMAHQSLEGKPPEMTEDEYFEHLEPILNTLASDCVVKQPENLKSFVQQWVEDKHSDQKAMEGVSPFGRIAMQSWKPKTSEESPELQGLRQEHGFLQEVLQSSERGRKVFHAVQQRDRTSLLSLLEPAQESSMLPLQAQPVQRGFSALHYLGKVLRSLRHEGITSASAAFTYFSPDQAPVQNSEHISTPKVLVTSKIQISTEFVASAMVSNAVRLPIFDAHLQTQRLPRGAASSTVARSLSLRSQAPRSQSAQSGSSRIVAGSVLGLLGASAKVLWICVTTDVGWAFGSQQLT